VAAGAKIEVKTGGKILTVNSVNLAFGSTTLGANSGLLATVDGVIKNTSVDASNLASEITGAFTLSATGTGASNGNLTFKSGSNGSLALPGKIKVTKGANEYDTAALGGTTITGANVTFNGSTGVINLSAVGVNVAAGGTLTTRGTGALQFSPATNYLQTNAADQTLPTLAGNGILNGTLALLADSVLTVGGAGFNVGATSGTGAAGLNVSSGTVKLNSGGSIVILQGTGNTLGTFTNGSNFTLGGTAGIPVVASEDPGSSTALAATELSGSFSVGSTNLTVGASAVVTVGGGGNITITRGSADNTITSISRLHSIN
jgi:hypothetical protein